MLWCVVSAIILYERTKIAVAENNNKKYLPPSMSLISWSNWNKNLLAETFFLYLIQSTDNFQRIMTSFLWVKSFAYERAHCENLFVYNRKCRKFLVHVRQILKIDWDPNHIYIIFKQNLKHNYFAFECICILLYTHVQAKLKQSPVIRAADNIMHLNAANKYANMLQTQALDWHRDWRTPFAIPQ